MNKGVIVMTIVLLFLGMSLLPGQEKQAKGLKIAEAKLGKDVQNKKIVDTTSTFALNDKAYLWLKILGGPSDSITVTWKTGTETYPTKLNVGGSFWRTWSYKTLSDAGEWTVTVADADGNVLKELKFDVKGEQPKK